MESVYKAVKYEEIDMLLLQAIKEQQQIEELKKGNEEMKARIEKLEKKIVEHSCCF